MRPRILFCFVLAFCFQQAISQEHSFVPSGTVSNATNERATLYFNQAHDSFDVRNYEAAAILYARAIAADTNLIDAYDNLGLTYRQLGKLDSAEYYYLRSFYKNPKNPLQLNCKPVLGFWDFCKTNANNNILRCQACQAACR